MDIHVVILAAGKGTRMKSARPKVLHRVAGLPLIEHVLATRRRASTPHRPPSSSVIRPTTLTAALSRHPDLTFVVQEPQLGTAHALLTTEHALARHDRHAGPAVGRRAAADGRNAENTGRSPSSRPAPRRRSSPRSSTIRTATGGSSGPASRLHVSSRRRTPARPSGTIREINSGIYAFALDGLFDAVRGIAAENAQGEYYLPDLVAIYRQRGLERRDRHRRRTPTRFAASTAASSWRQ